MTNPNIKENDGQVSVHFDSMLELMDYQAPSINSDRFNEYMGRTDRDEYGSYDRTWYGRTNRTAKDVINHALLGDDTLYRSLANKIGELERAVGSFTKTYVQQIKRAERRKVRSDFGDELDIHKVYQGQLDKAWSRTERVEVDKSHHLVTILVEIVGNSNESADDTLWRSAIAVKLVDDLLKAGKSVKVVCGSVSNGSMYGKSKLLSTSVVVKQYNERLSLPRLAAMTNLGFFRAAGFAMLCAQDSKCTSSLGYSVNMNDDNMPIHLKEEVDAGHTKYVHIGRISTLRSAIDGLKKAHQQMKDFS